MAGPQCTFGDGPAIGCFAFVRGCVARQRQRIQRLCLHHVVNATPIDGMVLLEDYSVDRVLVRGEVPGPYEVRI